MRPGYGESIAIESDEELKTVITGSLLQPEGVDIDILELRTKLHFNNGQIALDGFEAKQAIWSLTDLAEINSPSANKQNWRLDFIGRLAMCNDKRWSRHVLLRSSDNAFSMLEKYVRHPGFTSVSACAAHVTNTLDRLGQERNPIPRFHIPKLV